jgi:putrescine aminotransferase
MIELNCLVKDPHQIQVYRTESYWAHTNHGRVLDTICGNMSFIWGFDNQFILDHMYESQKNISYLNFKSNEICEQNQQLIRLLCEQGNFHAVSYAVSGTDGVECAIAMNWHYWRQKNPAKKKIISFTPGYSGASRLCKSLRGDHYDPDVIVLPAPTWTTVDQRSALEDYTFELLQKRLTDSAQIGAVLMESIPWADGLRPWSDHWWARVRQLCTQHQVNLIIDDIMGGMGKLGHQFSHQRYHIQPDMVILGKALTNGFSPLSCVCASQDICDTVKGTWDYSHTWQPNMAGVAAALAVWQLFDTNKIAWIEDQLIALGDALVSAGHVSSYVVIGLLFHVNLTRPISTEKFHACGLSDSPGIPGSSDPNLKKRLIMCAPAIADQHYFAELHTRLLGCFDTTQ